MNFKLKKNKNKHTQHPRPQSHFIPLSFAMTQIRQTPVCGRSPGGSRLELPRACVCMRQAWLSEPIGSLTILLPLPRPLLAVNVSSSAPALCSVCSQGSHTAILCHRELLLSLEERIKAQRGYAACLRSHGKLTAILGSTLR